MKKKKIIAWVLTLALLLCIAPLSSYKDLGFFTVAKAAGSSKTVRSIEIVSLPEKLDYYFEVDGYETEYYYDFDMDYISYFYYEIDRYGLQIKVNYKDGTSVTSDDPYYIDDNEINIIGQEEGETWNIGKHRVTVEYMGKGAYFDINVVENPVRSIEIARLPEKLKYYQFNNGYFSTFDDGYYDENDEYVPVEVENYIYNIETYGILIKYNLKNGTSVYGGLNYFTFNYDVIGQDYTEIWGIGKHTVSINLMGFETSYEIEIVENPVKKVEITKLPDLTTYYEGVDGYWDTYFDYEYDSYGNITYDEYGDPIMNEIEYFNYSIDPDGIQLKYTFKDGTVKYFDYYDLPYNCDIECDQPYYVPWSYGKHTVFVNTMGCTATYEIEIKKNPVKSIAFEKLNLKDSYIPGEYVDIAGSVLKVTNTDGSVKKYTITDENTYSYYFFGGKINGRNWYLNQEQNGNRINCTFEHLGKEITFSVPINTKKTVTGFEFLSVPKSPYGVGSSVKLSFSDGTIKNTNIISCSILKGDDFDNGFWEAGFLKTGIGVFEIIYYFNNLFQKESQSLSVEINNKKFEISDPYSDAMISIAKTMRLSSVFRRFNTGSDKVFFSGEVTKSNIDMLINISRTFAYKIVGLDWTSVSASSANVKKMLNYVFGISNVDLTLSDNYYRQKDLYYFSDWIYGEALDSYEYNYEQKNGLTYVKETRTSDTDGTAYFYTIFNEAGKCVYAATVSNGHSTGAGLGDINNDSLINSSDALLALQHSVDKIRLTGDSFVCADVNKDSMVNSTDALKILQYSVGIIKNFS